MRDPESYHSDLADYARGELTFAEFSKRMAEAVTLRLSAGDLAVVEYREKRLPRVGVRVDDVRSMVQRFKRGELSSSELAAWASVMTMMDSYVLECRDPGESTVVWNILDALSVPRLSGAHGRKAVTEHLKTLDRIRRPSPAR